MSRLAFREPVASPRPRAATAMAALATLTLAITSQLAWPVVLVGAASIGWAAVRSLPSFRSLGGGRTEELGPTGLRLFGLLLNLGLLLSVAVAVGLWVRGMLAVVALANFAVLAQALQLADTRPRRSEFLLVAIAVFQVVLAANLTDSGLFPPLLVAFTVAVVWTLIVHTLRAEALEAGEPEAARRALAGGLRRTAVVASLASVLLAALLFPVLPRIRSGALLSHGLGIPIHKTGFSDRVELGAIGQIRQDDSLVMRVEMSEGEVPAAAERYWRGIGFDHFDGRRWSVTPDERLRVRGDSEVGLLFGQPSGPRIRQHITRERIEGGVLFTAGKPAWVQGGGLGKVQRDANGSVFAPTTEVRRIEYQMVSEPSARDGLALQDDRAEPPKRAGERFLQLPELDPELGALARRAVEGIGGDAARAERLETWLRRNGRYTDDLPDYAKQGRSPVEGFLLGGLEGHCEYFASSMVVLARHLGLPARVVNGYAGGRSNRLGGFIEVSQSDAHAWVEVHYAQAGWVRYDPTPPDLRMAGADARRRTTLAELASAVELWWFRNVVDFDRGHQARALKSLWLKWRAWRQERGSTGTPQAAATPAPTPGRDLGMQIDGRAWGLAAGALLLGLLAADWRRRRTSDGRLPEEYARALRLLARRGHRRSPTTTARGFVREVRPQLPEAAAAAFAALTEGYLRQRFGDASAAPSAGTELAALRAALRDSLPAA